jgi:hypothetical protein
VFQDDHFGLNNSEQALRYNIPLIVKDPAILKPNPDILKDKGLYLLLDVGAGPNPGQWSHNGLKGFYIDQNETCASLDDLPKILSFLTDISGDFPQADTLILGNGRCPIKHKEMGRPDIRSLDHFIQTLHDDCPQFNLWLEVPVEMISLTGGLLVKVLEKKVTKGESYIRINLKMKASMREKISGAGCQILNLSKSGEEERVLTGVTGQGQESEAPLDVIKTPSSVEAGNILLVTNMGTAKSRDDHDNLPEHYLSARRICQVKI